MYSYCYNSQTCNSSIVSLMFSCQAFTMYLEHNNSNCYVIFALCRASVPHSVIKCPGNDSCLVVNQGIMGISFTRFSGDSRGIIIPARNFYMLVVF